MTNIEEYLKSLSIEFNVDVELKSKTWIKRGGVAKYWIQPSDIAVCESIVAWCQLNNIEPEIIGNTTNCYFLNDYNPFLVISTLNLRGMKVNDDNTIECECGYNITKFAKYCSSNGYAGYEGFVGLPGTVGGAAINNAGCYGSLTSDLVKSVVFISEGKKIELSNAELKYRHRSSIIKRQEIKGFVSKVVYDVSKREDSSILLSRITEYKKIRGKFYEHKYPNLGTTYCRVILKKLPFYLWVYNRIYNIANNIFVKDELTKHRNRVKLFLNIHNAGEVSKYISELGYLCFTWKDDGADAAFNEYVKFMKRISVEAIMEVQVKGAKNES